MADVFISYSREDRAAIEKLAAALEGRGFSVWWDRNIGAGSEFSKDIERELGDAKAVVVAWSKHASESRWVRDEALVGAESGKLIPASLDGAAAPLGFRQFQTVVLAGSHFDPNSPAMSELLSAIQLRTTGASPPPARSQRFSLPRLPILLLAGAATLALISAVALLTPFMTPHAAAPPGEGISELNPEEGVQAAFTKVSSQAPPAASIAVLPFADLSPAGDQAYFSDGIAEEILNVLARIDGLMVASRTSSFQFRDGKVGTPAIAREMGVRHILEGSVRKAGATIRITAQLIDASSDRHLWSETYDRPLTAENIFEIQDEIADAIVRQLANKMGVGAATPGAVSVQADTQNVDAYELYLKGRGLFIARGTENLKEAARTLEQATTLDPKFARAWEMLAAVYSISEAWDITDRRYARLALDVADTALRLNPDLSMAYAARGEVVWELIEQDEAADWQTSLADLNEAIARDPKNATAWFWRGADLLVLGFFDRAVQDFSRCHEVDPGYDYCAQFVAFAHLLAGRDEEALRLFEGEFEHVTVNGNINFAAAYVARGDLNSARDLLTDTFMAHPQLVAPLFGALTGMASDAARAKALALVDGLTLSGGGETAARFALGDYNRMPINLDSYIWWSRHDERYLKSPARKALMRRLRLPDYWRAHGYPPQCRPAPGENGGVDDFECD